MLQTLANLGMPELIVILVVVLLLFGSTRIPQLMRGMGQGISEFKKGMRDGEKQDPPAGGGSTSGPAQGH